MSHALRQRWGDAAFTPDGSVDRPAIARIVFAKGDAAESDRRFLEGVLHPRIGRRLKAERDKYAAEGRPVVVLDAALLFEAGWQVMCDLVLFVDAPREVRLERARKRGWSDAEVSQREAAQWPVDDKRRAADLMIANDGSEEELCRAVDEFWDCHIAGCR